MFRQNQEQVYARPIPAEVLKDLVQYFKRENICYGLGTSYYVAETNWEDILDEEVERLRQEGRDIPAERVRFAKEETKHQIGMQTVASIEEFLETALPVYSISLVTYDERKIAAVEKKLEEGGVLSLTVSGPHNAEIMDKNGNKGDALEHLCSLLGITLEETAAIGDSMNDYEMIKRAGFGIAMENAMDEVKAVSQYVTKTQMEDGVASVISYILGEEKGE